LALVLGLLVGCGKGALSVTDYCEQREAMFEAANGVDDRKALLMKGCIENLGKPAAAGELACRTKCLRAGQDSTLTGTPRLTELNRCDATCF
jgi:hypothetical protein